MDSNVLAATHTAHTSKSRTGDGRWPGADNHETSQTSESQSDARKCGMFDSAAPRLSKGETRHITPRREHYGPTPIWPRWCPTDNGHGRHVCNGRHSLDTQRLSIQRVNWQNIRSLFIKRLRPATLFTTGQRPARMRWAGTGQSRTSSPNHPPPRTLTETTPSFP